MLVRTMVVGVAACVLLSSLTLASGVAPGSRRPGPAPYPTAAASPAGDMPAFLSAVVEPIKPPESWRAIYREVERCAGRPGNYDVIRWAVMPAPLQGPKGPTFAFTVRDRIVLVRNDTTYLRHEMLHHVLEVSGWHPRALAPGKQYTIADLHPSPPFGRCTAGR
jgi:hypothetical protein